MFLGKEFGFQFILVNSPPNGGHPSHIIIPANGVEGVLLTAKMDENTIGMVFGCFWARNPNFGFILVNSPPMAVSHPMYTLKQGGGGVQLTIKWVKTNRYGFRVSLGKEFEFRINFGHPLLYGGHPLHLYPSSRVEGAQLTTTMGIRGE